MRYRPLEPWATFIFILVRQAERHDPMRPMGEAVMAGHSLSVGLQLTDLEQHHEIVFTVARPSSGAGQRCQFGGRDCEQKKRWRRRERGGERE